MDTHSSRKTDKIKTAVKKKLFLKLLLAAAVLIASFFAGYFANTLLQIYETKTKVTVHFDLNQGEGQIRDRRIKKGSDFVIPAYDGGKQNCIFLGWSRSNDDTADLGEGDILYGLSADITLYAIWEGVPLTVTLVDDVLSKQVVCDVKCGEFFTVPQSDITEREGYTFDGWIDENGVTMLPGYVKAIYANQEWHAVWAPNKYLVLYHANGGEGSMEKLIFFTGDTVILTPCAFYRDGYRFAGWSCTPDGPVQYQDQAAYQELSDTTADLYAVWEPDTAE